MIGKSTPVGGKLMTTGHKMILALVAAGVAAIAIRFAFGLGATTAMNDGYPWGIWIAYDVVTGTAIACGGYAIAILVYIFNKGRYHTLVRPAILTSALGYSLAGLGVAIDVGRPWYLWRIPLEVWRWNKHSVLLEVAVCIMAYMIVLWLELSPAFLERWQESHNEKLRAFAVRWTPLLEKALIYIIALGVLLPTMHQSSLGSLMMLAGPRLHPLWFTPFLPMFFLVTCVGMGYAVVVFENVAAAAFFGRAIEYPIIRTLERSALSVGLFVVVWRLWDLVARGVVGEAFKPTFFAFAFWCEMILFLGPWWLRFVRNRVTELQRLVGGGMLLILGGAVYRFNVFLVGFQPGPGYRYFPSVIEVLITAGLIAAECAAYIAIVRYFPILAGHLGPVKVEQVTSPATVAVAPAN